MSTWVIGGTSGIGKAISDILLASSDKNGMIYSTGEEVDVTDYDALGSQLDGIVDTSRDSDRLDRVFYCAGINELEWLGRMGSTGCSNQLGLLEVNVFGFIQLMDILVSFWHQNLLAKDKGIDVVAISSDAAERPMRTSVGYCASKAALNMAVRVAARELGPMGWRVNAVSPGMMSEGQMTNYIDKRVHEVRGLSKDDAFAYEMHQAVVKDPARIDPEHIANFAIRLTEMQSLHLNGSIHTINGGR